MKKQPLIETHGKEESSQPTTLEQVWGYNEMSRYGTLDPVVYEGQIKQMNRSDLETHARRMGVLVVESTARLQDKLRQEFANYTTYLHKPAEPKRPNVKMDPEAMKVLAEGR